MHEVGYALVLIGAAGICLAVASLLSRRTANLPCTVCRTGHTYPGSLVCDDCAKGER